MLKQTVATGVIVTLLAACSQTGGRDGGIRKQDVGALTGAVGGAWVGSNVGKGKGNIAAIAAGTLLGAFLGSEVGASLDRADVAYHDRTAQTAFESSKTGISSSWSNPDSGHSGTITPTKTYQTAAGPDCREYTQTITVGNKSQEGYGTACRQQDGSWKILN